jgi:lysophospholipase L1-like esterase
MPQPPSILSAARWRPLALTLASLTAAYAVGSALYAGVRFAQSAALARRSKPFEQAGHPDAPRLLVVGDSTAEGTGASGPDESLPGLIARAHPLLTVVNRGRDGARYGEFAAQLADPQRFDAVLVLGGGNDVIRMTGAAALRESVRQVARLAAARADIVVLMPPGNIGNAPFFLPPWRRWMRRRSLALQAIVAEAAHETGARHVSLFMEREHDPFAQDAAHMNASDGLHPSDAGYRLWHRELQAQAQLTVRLRRAGRTATP